MLGGLLAGFTGAAAPAGDDSEELDADEVAQEQEHDATQEISAGGASSGNAARASSGGAATLGLANIWGLANAVSHTVKAHAGEIVKSVAQTNWKAELMAFSKEAAEEGKHISHKTAEVVQHLPEVVEQLHIPEQAERVATQLTHSAQPAISNVGGSLKTFGVSLLSGTKELIDQVRDAVEGEMAQAAKEGKRLARSTRSATGGALASVVGGAAGGTAAAASSMAKLAAVGAKYNRFEAEVAAMQRDSSTYCDEPADAEDFARWREAFSLDAVQAQVDAILADNGFMAELHARIVPAVVEREAFWLRYFYKLHKLQAKQEARQALLGQRAKATAAEQPPQEEVGWDDLDVPDEEGAKAESTLAAAAAEGGKPAASEPPAHATEGPSADAAAEPISPPPAGPASIAAAASGSPLAVSQPAAAAAATQGEQPTGSAAEPSCTTGPTPHTPTPAANAPETASAASQAPTLPAAAPQRESPKGHDSAGSAPDEALAASVETASDGSRGEWCVVGSTQGSGSSGPSHATAAAAVITSSSDGSHQALEAAPEPPAHAAAAASPAKARQQREPALRVASAAGTPVKGSISTPTARSAGGAKSIGNSAAVSPAAIGKAGVVASPSEPAASAAAPGKREKEKKKPAAGEEEDEAWGDWD